MNVKLFFINTLFLVFFAFYNSAAWSNDDRFAIYADGSVEELQMTESYFSDGEIVNLDNYSDDIKTDSIPVDVSVAILDLDTKEPINTLSPGQTVYLQIYFNQLGQWPISYEDLIGKKFKLVYITLGIHRYIDVSEWVIEPGYEQLNGIGELFTLPEDVQPGRLMFIGGAFSRDLEISNNIARENYLVR